MSRHTSPSTHPEELLAEYADGMLDERARAEVDAHLGACATCREEVALAGGAFELLSRLPEEPVPFGVMNPVTAEIGRRTQDRRPAWGQRAQWVAGFAVAAALVAVVAVSLPNLGSSERGAAGGDGPGAADAPQQEDAAGEASKAFAMEVTLERQSTDYDDEALAALATEVAEQTEEGRLSPPAAGGSEAATKDALACVARGAGIAEQDVLIRLIEASYRGKPAFVAVYLEGPGAGEPPRSVVVWVVSSGGCEFRQITSKRI